jgi:hypothetical protein
MSFIKRSWRGEEKLWRVFWLYGVLLGIAISIVYAIIKGLLDLGWPMVVAAMAFYAVYQFWLLVSQWRCAWNVNWRGWGYIARFLVVLGFLGWIFGVAAVLLSKDLFMNMISHADECAAAMEKVRGKTKAEQQAYFRDHPQEFAKCTAMLPEEMRDKLNQSITQGRPATATPTLQPQNNASTPAQQGANQGGAERAVYEKMCTDEMIDNAIQHEVDPTQYIADNPVYIQQCIQYQVDSADHESESQP